ncbi:YppF family protein [Rossellomorea oryzaecorticis]|uniref:YppF family protein n=1 Tax=Rossellomorea oryzaecorticis TaxID=1396505 RepID=A0ABU9KAK3_9BACI
MNFSELLKKYENQKQCQATDGPELLMLTKKLYISNEISLQNYKELVRQINLSDKSTVPTL